MECWNLQATEIGFAFFEKRGEPFGAIFRGKTVRLKTDFFFECILHFLALVADHRALHVTVGEWRPGSQMFGKRACLFLKLRRGKDLVYDANLASVSGGERFAGVKKFRGAREPNQARQEIRGAKIGIKAKLRKTLRKRPLFGGDPQVACERKTHSTSRSGPVYGRDHWLRHRCNREANLFPRDQQF